jgi:hypothetical protein
MSANDALLVISRPRYDALRAQLEAAGYEVLTHWRPGLKRIRLGAIVLGPPAPDGRSVMSAPKEDRHAS